MNTWKKIGFYFLSFTWGIIMTFIGCLVFLALIITGHKPHKFYDRIYIKVNDNWGGCELGPWFICGQSDDSLHLKQHESGHGFQNIILGPLMPFVVSLPSAARYWLFNIKTQQGRTIFSYTVVLLLALIGLGFFIPGLMFIAWWAIGIGLFVIAYTVYMFIWLCCTELPKFANSSTRPKYDDAWFEGTASRWGAKVYPEEYRK